MKKYIDWSASLLLAGGALTGAAGCGGDDTTFPPESGTDASADGASHKDGTADAPAMDVARDAGRDSAAEAEAAPPAPHVLVTNNYSSSSELIAVNVTTKAVDGTLTFSGPYGMTDAYNDMFPFLLEQYTDIVGRLDPTYPWLIDSSWNVRLHDGKDGDLPNAEPVRVAVGPKEKSYVLRYNRNEIAVIEASKDLEAGSPVGTIDLSSLVQKNDKDGLVDMLSAVYVPAKSLLFVVLQNIDRDAVSASGFDYCTDTVSTVIGIDTTTDTVKSLGGGGPGGGIPLSGFNPTVIAYDTLGQRILIAEEGCYPRAKTDAGVSGLTKGGVEAMSVVDYSTRILLDTSKYFPLPPPGDPPSGYPSGLAYISKTEAVLGFDFTGSEVHHWNPEESVLGPRIPNAPDVFVADGAGNLVGTSTTYPDGGAVTTVVSVAIGTGDSTPLSVANPFSHTGGYVGGVDLWPHP
jgi:hypothetical protein